MRVAKPVDQADPVLSKKGSRLGGRVSRDEDVPIGILTEVSCVVDELPRSRRVGVSLYLEDDRCTPVAEPYDAVDTSIVADRYLGLDCLDSRHAAEQLERPSFQLFAIIY